MKNKKKEVSSCLIYMFEAKWDLMDGDWIQKKNCGVCSGCIGQSTLCGGCDSMDKEPSPYNLFLSTL